MGSLERNKNPRNRRSCAGRQRGSGGRGGGSGRVGGENGENAARVSQRERNALRLKWFYFMAVNHSATITECLKCADLKEH